MRTLRVVAVAANPALDHTLVLDDLVRGGIHRTKEGKTTAGGKGTNAARAAKRLGAEVRVIAPVGGASGAYFADLARVEGIEVVPVPIRGEIRTCTLVVSRGTGEETVLNEEGPTLGLEEWEILGRLAVAHSADADAVLLSGSLPGGVPAILYARILESARPETSVVDSRGPELQEAVAAGPTWVHLTALELAATYPGLEASESGRREAMRDLVRRGAGTVVVTDGPGPVLVEGRTGPLRVEPPRVEVSNTVGCGDALAGALAVFSAQGLPAPDVVRAAVAAASAAATTSVPGEIPAELARELLTGMSRS